MKKRLVLAAVCILTLPMWFSPSKVDKVTKSTPFATVALAGHTMLGAWCECGAPGCTCYPGEDPSGQSIGTVPDKPAKKQPADLGSETLLVLGVLLLMLRYKA